MHHLKYYSNLIEEYKEKTGKFPLQEKTKMINNPSSLTEKQKNQIKTFPVYVEIANAWQDEEAKKYNDAIPFSHYNGTDKLFFEELEDGLGKKINEYYDPQKSSFERPNFYVYVVDQDGNYYFAIHTYNNYPFGLYLEKNYHKIEVSNIATNKQSIQSNELFSREDYIKEAKKGLIKLKYFSNLDKEYLQDSK